MTANVDQLRDSDRRFRTVLIISVIVVIRGIFRIIVDRQMLGDANFSWDWLLLDSYYREIVDGSAIIAGAIAFFSGRLARWTIIIWSIAEIVQVANSVILDLYERMDTPVLTWKFKDFIGALPTSVFIFIEELWLPLLVFLILGFVTPSYREISKSGFEVLK